MVRQALGRGRWAVRLANRFFAGLARQAQAQLDELLHDLEHAAER